MTMQRVSMLIQTVKIVISQLFSSQNSTTYLELGDKDHLASS